MDGFDKIELKDDVPLNKTTNNTSAKPSQDIVNMRRTRKVNFKNKKFGIPATIVGIVLLISIFLILLPGLKVYASFKRTYAQAKITGQDLKKQDIEKGSADLALTKTYLTQTQKDYNLLFVLRLIPFINGYYDDGSHAINAGFHALNAATIVVDSIKPYADVLGLKGSGSFTGGSAEDRIKTTVLAMEKITPRIDEVANELSEVKKEVDYINPNDYPSFLVGKKLKDQIVSGKKATDDGVAFVNEAKPLIKILPSLLGQPDAKKYLLIFQNDKELRPTGGFITAYAIFNVDKGVISVDTSNDIYTLDNTISGKSKAPAPILKYLANVPLFNLRDSNLSPDFPTSMETFTSMYKKAGDYRKVDGIVALDTGFLVSVMNVLGDINLDGSSFTTKTDPRCNCPQVIYQLESYADQPVGYLRENRKGIIGDLMLALMKKALSSSPRQYWGPLVQTGFDQIAQKHLMFYLYNPDAQRGIYAINAGGKIMDFDGDYLHINEANFGGAKSNMYIQEAVTQDYSTSSDGVIKKTVTINYKNPFAPSDCNLERGNLCLNALQRDWFRIYVPKGSKMVDSTGSEVKMTSYDELGKTVFEGFLTVRPLGVKTFTISYTLPFKVAHNSTLPVMIQKQPGTYDIDYTVNVNGRKIKEFPLTTDVQFSLNL